MNMKGLPLAKRSIRRVPNKGNQLPGMDMRLSNAWKRSVNNPVVRSIDSAGEERPEAGEDLAGF
jgi:hypothetical protein